MERVYTYAAALGLAPILLPGAGGWVPVPLAACAADRRRPLVLRQLRATRLARDIPTAEIAAVLGVAGSTLIMAENGARRLQLDQAHDYADALGLVLAVAEISASVTALVEAGGRPHLQAMP